MNFESPDIKNLPYQSTIVLSGQWRQNDFDTMSDMLIDDVFYAAEIGKTPDKTAWQFILYSMSAPKREDIAAHIYLAARFSGLDNIDITKIDIAQCPDKNWLEEVHRAFPPRTIGDFYVYGSHVQSPEIPETQIPLKIDAASAFGSGEHETTQLCLARLSALKQKYNFQNILDMGCGSGILSIAAARLWPDAKITGVDIDAESIRVSQRHQEMNDISHIIFECGDGYNAFSVNENAPYDLIIANILTRPLIAMAPQAGQVANSASKIILSGLLNRQADDVAAAYQQAGFTLGDKTVQDAWACLLLNKQ